MVWFSRIIVTAAVAASFVQAAVETLDPSAFTLLGKPGHYESIIAKLDNALPNVTVAEVLRNTNHPNPAYSGPSHWVQDFT